MKKIKELLNEQKMSTKFANAGRGQRLNEPNKKYVFNEPQTSSEYFDRNLYFESPYIEGEPMLYNELLNKIREFSLTNLSTSPLYYSCLILKTFNEKSNQEECSKLFQKYINNILSDPENYKFRALRCNNTVFKDKVLKTTGANEFLEAFGFVPKMLPLDFYNLTPQEQGMILDSDTTFSEDKSETFYVFCENLPVDVLTEKISFACDLLERTKPLHLNICRDVRVYHIKNISPKFEPPDQFFTHGIDDLKKIYAHMKQKRDDDLILKTKAMRLAEQNNSNEPTNSQTKDKKVLQYTFIRVKFPQNLILQATFSSNDKFASVVQFIRESTNVPTIMLDDKNSPAFSILTTWGQKLFPYTNTIPSKSKDSLPKNPINQTLTQLNLVPTAQLIFHPHVEYYNKNIDEYYRYLKPELLSRVHVI